MINVKVLHEKYREYCIEKQKYEQLEKEFEEFKEDNDIQLKNGLLTHYNYVINMHNRVLLHSVLEDYPLLERYHNFIINLQLQKCYVEEYFFDEDELVDEGEYVCLNHDEKMPHKYSIVNLSSKEMITSDDIDENEIAFLINILNYHGCYIGSISQNDLPALMVILENIEDGYIEPGCESIRKELQYARQYDEENKDNIKENYPINMYELVTDWLKEGINIEDLYMNCDTKDKDVVLVLYYALSIFKARGKEENTKVIRTTSSIINQDILKKIYKMKKE